MSQLRAYKPLFISYITLLLLSLVGLYFNEKGDVVIWMNGWHQYGLDQVMVVITKMGEVFGFLAVLILLIFFEKRRSVLAYLIACALMLGLVSLLKMVVFSDFMRPAVVLEDEHLHFIRGLYVNKKFSFPSGHTAAAFTYFFYFALTRKKVAVQLTCLLAAVLIGGSRIYLAQHFLMDVIAGSVLGVTIASLAWFVVSEKWLSKYPKLGAKIIGGS